MSYNIILISLAYLVLMRKDLINFIWLPSFLVTFMFIKNFVHAYRRLDDVSYFKIGSDVFNSFLTNFPDIGEVIHLSDGIHIGYYLYNGLLTEWLNFTYNDITYLNCCLIALVLPKLQAYVPKSFIIPLYFSPIIFSFPLFLNVKDSLLLVLTIIFLEQIKKQNGVGRNTCLIVVVIAMVSMRFYLPFLLMLWISICPILIKGKINGMWLMLLLGVAVIIEMILPSQFSKIYTISGSAVVGFTKMFVSPLPWNLTDEYYFLIFYSVFVFLRFPFIIIGAVLILNRSSERTKELLLFCVICAMFLGSFPSLAGERQRLFFEPFLSLIGTIGFFGVLKSFANNSRY